MVQKLAFIQSYQIIESPQMLFRKNSERKVHQYRTLTQELGDIRVWDTMGKIGQMDFIYLNQKPRYDLNLDNYKVLKKILKIIGPNRILGF